MICALHEAVPYAPGMGERAGYARCGLAECDLTVRAGGTLVAPNFGRRALSVPDARATVYRYRVLERRDTSSAAAPSISAGR